MDRSLQTPPPILSQSPPPHTPVRLARRPDRRVGTSASVICRVQDTDYTGHSLSMLQRIAAALNKRVEIRFVSTRRKPQPA
jgi:hypothetical protein